VLINHSAEERGDLMDDPKTRLNSYGNRGSNRALRPTVNLRQWTGAVSLNCSEGNASSCQPGAMREQLRLGERLGEDD
jgi:hypothetical protein